MDKINLSIKIGPLRLKNPILTASGTFGCAEEFADIIDLNRLGGVILKSVTLRPRQGNNTPRIMETPAGMLNSIGLENKGIKHLCEFVLPKLRAYDTAIIVNIAGETTAEYEELAEIVNSQQGVSAIELNISCPNVKKGGMLFGTSAMHAGQLTAKVRAKTALPLIAKLTPNVTDIVEIAKSVYDSGADIVSLTNTFMGMSINWRRRASNLANLTGGLSGACIKPISLRMVQQVAFGLKKPVIGIGGIMNAEDVLEYMCAGASAVEIGTANFLNPAVMMQILDDLPKLLAREKIQDINSIIGTLKV